MVIDRQLRKDNCRWPQYVESGPLVSGDQKGIGIQFEGMDFMFGLSLASARTLIESLVDAIRECEMDAN